MNTPIVDIIVPTWNQAPLTAACARSIRESTEPEQARVIWVDNGSAPAERAAIADAWQRDWQRDVLALLLPENLGFVKATNAGIAASTAPFILLLTNDTELRPGWLAGFLATFEARPDVGLVGPWATPLSGQWQARRPNLAGDSDGPNLILHPTRMLAFFCTMIRREVIVDVGYLSEEWGIGWGDDDDYCARAQLAGWKLAVRTDVEVLHHGGRSFNALVPEEWSAIRAANLARLERKWPQYRGSL